MEEPEEQWGKITGRRRGEGAEKNGVWQKKGEDVETQENMSRVQRKRKRWFIVVTDGWLGWIVGICLLFSFNKEHTQQGSPKHMHESAVIGGQSG